MKIAILIAGLAGLLVGGLVARLFGVGSAPLTFGLLVGFAWGFFSGGWAAQGEGSR